MRTLPCPSRSPSPLGIPSTRAHSHTPSHPRKQRTPILPRQVLLLAVARRPHDIPFLAQSLEPSLIHFILLSLPPTTHPAPSQAIPPLCDGTPPTCHSLSLRIHQHGLTHTPPTILSAPPQSPTWLLPRQVLLLTMAHRPHAMHTRQRHLCQQLRNQPLPQHRHSARPRAVAGQRVKCGASPESVARWWQRMGERLVCVNAAG